MAEEEKQRSTTESAAGQGARFFVKNMVRQGLSKAGSAIGSVAGPLGTVAGYIAGELVARFGKYLLIAAAVVVILFFIFFLIIFVSIIALITGGSTDTQPTAPTEICSTVPGTIAASNIQNINENIAIYRIAATEAGIPWEVLAAIHYEETNNSRITPSSNRGDGVYQIVSKDYPYPAGIRLTDGAFSIESFDAAIFIQNKASNGPVGRPLRTDMNPGNPADAQSIKDAFWGYNGRAGYMRDIAESLGFDPVTEGYEGSFYVMNNWDEARVGMTIKFVDPATGELIIRSVVRDGAWKIFIALRNATYDSDGKITQINDICVIVGDGKSPIGCPMIGGITTPFGFNISDYISLGWHYGVDIALGPVPADIRTTITGTAKIVESNAGGFTVVVENERFAVHFLHLSATGRVAGPVTVGQVIGQEDTSGLVTGQHVHYAIYKDGIRVNPMDFMPVSLNFTQPDGNDFTGISLPSGGWGTCDALPS